MRVEWSPEALQQARKTARYIARDRPGTAARWMAGLFKAVRRLESFPESGRRVEDAPLSGHRELPYGGHRVVYRVLPDHVRIVTVFHQRRAGPEGPPEEWLEGLAEFRGSHWEGAAEEIQRERDEHYREHDEESGSGG